MSNHYAIATVTATLQHVLDKAVRDDVSGATATMTSPDGPATGLPDPGVNIFLYQVTPSAAARNEDLPTRDSNGNLVGRPRVGLDLHYLLTFYGKDPQFEPQRVLGSAVRTLHAKPVLTRPQITKALSAYPVLLPSDLATDFELVKFSQMPLTLEELSKLWSVFFQTTYRLSVAYRGTVVLIESQESFASGLPVRLRNLYVETFRAPLIEAVVAATGDHDLIFAGSAILLRGQRFFAPTVDVVVDGVPAVTGTVTDTEVSATLPALQAGVHGAQIQRPREMGTLPVAHTGVVSNVFPFVLHPKIRKNGAYHISLAGQKTKTVGLVTYHSADITIDIDPVVGKNQRVAFLLNELGAATPNAYAFVSNTRPADSGTITIRAVDVLPGTYLVRVRVDGAESPLDVTANAYSDPKVTI